MFIFIKCNQTASLDLIVYSLCTFITIIIKFELNPISFERVLSISLVLFGFSVQCTSHSSTASPLTAQHGHRCNTACHTTYVHSHNTGRPHTLSNGQHKRFSYISSPWIISNSWTEFSYSVSNFDMIIFFVNETNGNLLNTFAIFFPVWMKIIFPVVTSSAPTKVIN